MITRRAFIEGCGVTTVGLYFGLYAYADKKTAEPDGRTNAKPKTTAPEEEAKVTGLKPNVFVHVSPSGVVTIVNHRSEMGQGIRSSLPVLLADELGADMKHVVIQQADGDKKFGDQNTDGSNSVRGIYTEMRKAAATARVMLIAAAARRWNVDPKACVAQDHSMVHTKSQRKLGFGALAIEAGALPIPAPEQVVLRPKSELKHVGHKLPLLDGPAFVAGTAVYGADVRLPDMLIAVIARPPVVGGRIDHYDKKAALAVNGVEKLIEMPHPSAPYQFQPWGGVAVLAKNTWSAMQGRKALSASWRNGANEDYDSATFRSALEKTARSPGTHLRNVGDVDNALKISKRTLEAEYFVPHLPHVAMEPPVAVARYDAANGGHCEIWASTQNPQAARTEAARVLELSEDRVTVHVTFIGGGFGRKSKADFVSEAAFLSKACGRPVRVQFTREDDIHHDYLNTVAAQHLTAGLDENNHVTAWRHRTAFPPIKSLFDTSVIEPGAGDLQQGVLDFALAIPNVRAEVGAAKAHVRTGWLRSVYNIFHAFAINSFLDELAHARQIDPRENLLELIGPARQLSLKELGIEALANYGLPLDLHPVDAGRLRAVIEKVTAMANWKSRGQQKGRAFGLAAHRSFLSYAAVVASVTRNAQGQPWVDEVWIALDPATVINPDRVKAQLEGSVINGISHIMYGGVTHKRGAVEQNNFDGVNLVRMAVAPRRIHVEIIERDLAPGGVGEPGVPPVAPAVANAIFALTKIRVREFGVAHMKWS